MKQRPLSAPLDALSLRVLMQIPMQNELPNQILRQA
jgi:hypothetical protein